MGLDQAVTGGVGSPQETPTQEPGPPLGGEGLGLWGQRDAGVETAQPGLAGPPDPSLLPLHSALPGRAPPQTETVLGTPRAALPLARRHEGGGGCGDAPCCP